jgi:hypothetical protein
LVLHHSSVALIGHIKNLSLLEVTPDFDPARLSISLQCFPISIYAGLIIALVKKQIGEAVVVK